MDKTSYFEGRPLDIGTETVLLLDDTYVEDRWNVRRLLNKPHKTPHNPLVLADQPWEDRLGGGSVIHDKDENVFHMWYTVMDKSAWMHQFRLKDWEYDLHGMPYFPGYARSRDGVNWEKPWFEDKPYRDFKATNIIKTGVQKVQSPHVVWNQNKAHPERFMMTYKDNLPQGYGCLCLAYSDDGVHWRDDPKNPIIIGVKDTHHNMVYDPKRDRWLLFTRPHHYGGVVGFSDLPEENFKRRVAIAVGETPYEFSYPRVAMWPDECDGWDFDNIVGERVGHHFLGFVAHMQRIPRQEFNMHLAFSADGLSWQQLPTRQPWIDRGPVGSFDAGIVSTASNLVNIGDWSYLYYVGATGGQGARDSLNGMGRVEFRRDRFVAQMGNPEGGFLMTREMTVAAPKLLINISPASGYDEGLSEADAFKGPQIAVEVLARDNPRSTPRPVPGFTKEDSNLYPADLTDFEVTWKEKANLGDLVGKPIFFRFYLRNVGIYALRFSE